MKTTKLRKLLLINLGVILALLLASASWAQESADGTETAAEADDSLEEVIVTSRKREEALQDIPTSAYALTKEFMAQMNPIESIRDLTDLIPGITTNDVNLNFIAEPSIRGGGAGRNRYSASATGLYRSGAYVASAGPGGKNFARMDYFDMERAEVLRGPQGALYGRNALGGAINLISTKPGDTLSFDVSTRVGENEMFYGAFIANVPINDKFAVRFSYAGETRDDGFFTDVDGRVVDTIDYDHLRISLRYQPSENVDITYMYDDDDLLATPTIRISQSQVDQTGSEFLTFINTEHADNLTNKNHNLNVDVTLESGVLSFVGNYRDRLYHAGQDADFWIAPRETQARRFSQNGVGTNQFMELRYAANGTDNFRWLVGADHSKYDNNDFTDLTVNFPINTPTGLWFRTIDYGMKNWAVFGLVEYTLDSMPLTLTAEARYAQDDFYGALNQTRFNRDPIEVLRDFTVDNDWDNVPAALTASWEFEDQNAIGYVKVASSYRHGGMNDGVGSEHAKYPSVLTYDEESNLTWELGWKQTALDGKLIFNVAVFDGEYRDFIVGTDNGCPSECQLIDENDNPLGFNPDGTRIGADENDVPIAPNEEIPRTAFMDNVGDVSIDGFEVELAYLLPLESSGGSVRFNLAYAKQEGKVDGLDPNTSLALLANAGGADLIYMVPDQWKTQVLYRQPLGSAGSGSIFSGAEFVASANFTYESGGFWDLNVNNPNPMATQKRLNARLGLQTNNWSLMLNGSNITDEKFHLFHNSAVSYWRQVQPKIWFLEYKYHWSKG